MLHDGGYFQPDFGFNSEILYEDGKPSIKEALFDMVNSNPKNQWLKRHFFVLKGKKAVLQTFKHTTLDI